LDATGDDVDEDDCGPDCEDELGEEYQYFARPRRADVEDQRGQRDETERDEQAGEFDYRQSRGRRREGRRAYI
jgi:hypothetical protein